MIGGLTALGCPSYNVEPDLVRILALADALELVGNLSRRRGALGAIVLAHDRLAVAVVEVGRHGPRVRLYALTMNANGLMVLKAVGQVEDDGDIPMQARGAVIENQAFGHMSVGDRWRTVQSLIDKRLLDGDTPWPVEIDAKGAYPSYDGLTLTRKGRAELLESN